MPLLKLKNRCIGITLGDPAGIGPEITAKAIQHKKIRESSLNLAIIGDWYVFGKYCKKLPKNINFINCSNKNLKPHTLGKPTLRGAKASLKYLEESLNLYKDKFITSLVTAPVCKEYIQKIDNTFIGHTEYLATKLKVNHVGMFFISNNLKIIIATRHLPLKDISQSLTKKLIIQTVKLTHQSLKLNFRIKNPKIGICGLNPHAGEGGLLGKEELTKIIPAIKELKKNMIVVTGPFAADTLFMPKKNKQYDAIVAMYHDQGLIPIKTLYFDTLVNLTIGLPLIRTSPAHGTAFDIAGSNNANPSSMIEAILLAAKLTK